MATQQEVDDNINLCRQELAYYGNRVALRSQRGVKPTVHKQILFMLLQAYNQIAEAYKDEHLGYAWVSPWGGGDEYGDGNFGDVDWFNDIQQHVNRIGNSFHWLDLS